MKILKVTAAEIDEAKVDNAQQRHAERKLRDEADRFQKKLKRSEYRSIAHVTNNSKRAERLFSVARNLR